MSFADPILNKPAVATLLGCSERTLERRVRDGQFPPPVQFGKDSCWFESVVHKWLEAQRDAQLAWEPRPSKTRAGRGGRKARSAGASDARGTSSAMGATPSGRPRRTPSIEVVDQAPARLLSDHEMAAMGAVIRQ